MALLAVSGQPLDERFNDVHWLLSVVVPDEPAEHVPGFEGNLI
jgi:hypothetical protein